MVWVELTENQHQQNNHHLRCYLMIPKQHLAQSEILDRLPIDIVYPENVLIGIMSIR